jgi:hypothetical protein
MPFMRAVPGVAGTMCGRTGVGGFFVADFFVFFFGPFAFFFAFFLFFRFAFERFLKRRVVRRGHDGAGAVSGAGGEQTGEKKQGEQEGESRWHPPAHRRAATLPLAKSGYFHALQA